MTTEQARAFWLRRPGEGEILPETLAAPGEGEVLVRALYSGISRGTETLVFRGEVPASEHERMRAPFQLGHFPAPVKYGYASVGVVEHGPPALVGRTVFCQYPHQTRYVVPVYAVHPLPDAVPPARAVLAANMETAVNALWDAGPRVGARVTVVGAGTLGCLVARLAARIPGCRVALVDVEPARATIADALGVDFATPEHAPSDADLVVHASGTAAGLDQAIAVAGFEASVVELSWYGSRETSVRLGGAFHSRRLSLRSSQVGHVAAPMRARWSHRDRQALALALLADDALDCLLTGEDAFDDLPAVMSRLARGARDTLCHRIGYA